MNKVKIVFFDIDGTLLEMGKTDISHNTKRALQLLQENGIKICIATGRAIVAIPAFDGIVFDAILAFNGSFCIADNTVISKQPIPKEDVYRITYNASKMGRPISIATEDNIIANGKDKDLEDYFAIANEELIVSEEFKKYINHDVYQIMMGCNLEERKYILDRTQNVKLAAWWDRAIDIIPQNGGKGVAIENVLKYYQISKEEAIAFGDGANDIEMLLSVGTGVAMGNASDEVKNIAIDVCGNVEDDGIFNYLKNNKIITE